MRMTLQRFDLMVAAWARAFAALLPRQDTSIAYPGAGWQEF